MKLFTKTLSSDLWDDFQSYFEYDGSCSGCWCMNHRLPIGLDFEGEAAKLAMKQLVQSNRVFGLLAYCEGDSVPVGWCAVDRRKTLPGHDCIEEDIACESNVWSIHCVTSRKDFKNKGVEELLSRKALVLAKDHKAKMVEAYPEPRSEVGQPFKTWNVFNGYQSLFRELGFKQINRDFGGHGEFFAPMEWKNERGS